MIVGIGSDLVDINRVRGVMDRHPRRFIRRVLSPAEREAMPAQNQLSFVAARWAAKEAFAKALGTGMRAPLSWHGVSVKKRDSGQPYFCFAPTLADALAARRIARSHLSISHDGNYAFAAVVLEE